MSVSSLAPLLRLRLNSEPRVKKTREEGLCRRVFVPLQDKELLSLTRILHPLCHFSARSGAILGAFGGPRAVLRDDAVDVGGEIVVDRQDGMFARPTAPSPRLGGRSLCGLDCGVAYRLAFSSGNSGEGTRDGRGKFTGNHLACMLGSEGRVQGSGKKSGGWTSVGGSRC